MSAPIEMSHVLSVTPLGGFRLHVKFDDGSEGTHDFSALVKERGPIVEPLRDEAYFAPRVPRIRRADLAERLRHVP